MNYTLDMDKTRRGYMRKGFKKFLAKNVNGFVYAKKVSDNCYEFYCGDAGCPYGIASLEMMKNLVIDTERL
jgi:hypothetical protein